MNWGEPRRSTKVARAGNAIDNGDSMFTTWMSMSTNEFGIDADVNVVVDFDVDVHIQVDMDVVDVNVVVQC